MNYLTGELARIHQNELLEEAQRERLARSLRPDPRTAPARAGLITRLVAIVRRTPRATAPAETSIA